MAMLFSHYRVLLLLLEGLTYISIPQELLPSGRRGPRLGTDNQGIVKRFSFFLSGDWAQIIKV